MDRAHLLVIDPQNDFCDLPTDWCPPDPIGAGRLAPALAVTGAHQDMLRLATWVDEHREKIDRVTVTMDHHHRLDIAHPGFWRSADGTAVGPFTLVLAADVAEGRILTAKPQDRDRALKYLQDLEKAGRFTHMVWPVHCQIGTWGQAVHARLQQALDAWADLKGAGVTTVLKGENPWTEHYSAIRAEIPLDTDPATGWNWELVRNLEKAKIVYVAGEAGSHCVRATVEHLVEAGLDPEKIVLLEDAISPVTGFEAAQTAFFQAMADKGMRILKLEQAAGLLE
ncbi:MAG: isochorismatase family protein [Fibrobacteres bacterium]|nr:isochorismatase family protein [Fibrobacterota bacterium]